MANVCVAGKVGSPNVFPNTFPLRRLAEHWVQLRNKWNKVSIVEVPFFLSLGMNVGDGSQH